MITRPAGEVGGAKKRKKNYFDIIRRMPVCLYALCHMPARQVLDVSSEPTSENL